MGKKVGKTSKPKEGRPPKEQTDKLRKDLFDNWFGRGYSDQYIAIHLDKNPDTIAKHRRVWEDKIAVDTDFVARQHEARNNTLVVIDKIIHGLWTALGEFEEDKTMETKNGPIPNLGVMSLIQQYYDKIGRWTMIKNGVLASKTIDEKLEDVMAKHLEEIKAKQEQEQTAPTT